MAAFTDIFVADPADAQRLSELEADLQQWTSVQFEGLDEVKLARLYAIVSGQEFDKKLRKQFELRASGSESGPWVSQLPSALVAGLAQLSDVDGTAARWSAIEEFMRDRWRREDVTKALASLVAAARQAVAEHKSLLLRLAV